VWWPIVVDVGSGGRDQKEIVGWLPRKQTQFRRRVLADQETRLTALISARPDATLAE